MQFINVILNSCLILQNKLLFISDSCYVSLQDGQKIGIGSGSTIAFAVERIGNVFVVSHTLFSLSAI